MSEPTDQTAEDPGAALGEILPRLANRTFWLLEMTPTDRWPAPDAPPTPEMMQHFVEHLRWLEAREADGTILLSGPLDQEAGIGPGLTVLNVATREEAERLAAEEPFGRLGLRENRVRSWTVNEGSLTLTVKLFARTVRIDPPQG